MDLVEMEGVLDPALHPGDSLNEVWYEGDGRISPSCASMDSRNRTPDQAVTAHLQGEYLQEVYQALPAVGPSLAGNYEFLLRPGLSGRLCYVDGMFNIRDKLARIGVVMTVSGVFLGNTDVILNGLKYREIVKTDHRGVWWKYLEIDEYPDALFISPNGITYDLLKQAEREDNKGIFDQIVKRRTIANATSRQLHRKFV